MPYVVDEVLLFSGECRSDISQTVVIRRVSKAPLDYRVCPDIAFVLHRHGASLPHSSATWTRRLLEHHVETKMLLEHHGWPPEFGCARSLRR